MKLIVLTGLPGSGKTTLGEELIKKGISFIKIDDFYLTVPRVNEAVVWHQDKEYITNVYAAFTQAIRKALTSGDVVIEATGVSPRFTKMIQGICSQVQGTEVIKVYLKLDKSVAKERIENRNKTDYPIKMPLETLEHFVSKLEGIERDYDYEVDANLDLDLDLDAKTSILIDLLANSD